MKRNRCEITKFLARANSNTLSFAEGFYRRYAGFPETWPIACWFCVVFWHKAINKPHLAFELPSKCTHRKENCFLFTSEWCVVQQWFHVVLIILWYCFDFHYEKRAVAGVNELKKVREMHLQAPRQGHVDKWIKTYQYGSGGVFTI